jgi:prefoldin subunit 5
VTAEGDVDKVSLDLEAVVDYVQGEEGRATSLFPLDYLAAFVKAVRDAKVEEIVLQLGTDYPIRVDWDGAVKGTYLCAPRIETP